MVGQASAQCHSFFHFEQAALFVGQDSSPAADVHVGLFVRRYGWFRCAKNGAWRTRADLEGCPTTVAAIPDIGKTSGIKAAACATARILAAGPFPMDRTPMRS